MIAEMEEQIEAVKEELKKLREEKPPVDKAAIDELTKEEKSLNDQIKAEKEALEAAIEDIIYSAITSEDSSEDSSEE